MLYYRYFLKLSACRQCTVFSKVHAKCMSQILLLMRTFCRSAVVVTCERLVAIKTPLHAKLYFTPRKTLMSILVVCTTAALLNAYGFFLSTPVIMSYSNHTIFNYCIFPINAIATPNLYKYIQFSTLVAPILIVFIPLVMLITLNFSLLYYLRQNYKQNVVVENTVRRQQSKTDEQNITFVVAMMILSFVAFCSPSAFLLLSDWVRVYIYQQYRRPGTISIAVTISNLLVAFSKSSNFILYNVVSSNFRRHLLKLFGFRKQLLNKKNFRTKETITISALTCQSAM